MNNVMSLFERAGLRVGPLFSTSKRNVASGGDRRIDPMVAAAGGSVRNIGTGRHSAERLQEGSRFG
jgi:hypothetical protein